ncbi:hypothetical protein AB0I28_08430 [Phytomonospora sp. NPDC050363]|uniref:hypothetical protein n=1 Tax=Phytomonospora sp. NPDC050363 TaxID=3155642 RepID=UPI0034021FF7
MPNPRRAAPTGPVPVATAVALVLSVAWWLAPTMGTDTSAQFGHAEFFARYGFALVDFSWYGGTQALGYSLVSPPVMAVLGLGLTGVLTATASTALLTLIFVRTGLPHPLLGGLAAAVTMAGNLVSGRLTFGLGAAFGLAALAVLTTSWRRPLVLSLAAAAAVLASATSPVAGLFTGVAAAALLLVGERRTDGLVVGAAAAVPMAVLTLLFGDGGWMNFSPDDFRRSLVTTLVVAGIALAARRRVVLAGALITAAGLIGAYVLHTPVGANAIRLTVQFALPLALAMLDVRVPASWPRPRLVAGAALAVLAALLVWWQPPVNTGDLRDAGNPAAETSFYAPLLAELAARGPVGRIEIPPTRNYWEAAYVASEVPLARGWLRQLDIERDPLFFDALPGGQEGTGVPLDAGTYREWLLDTGVSYVALPDTEFSWVGRAEAALVAGGLPYLREVWSSPDWRLFEVDGATGVVAAPATLVSSRADGLTFDAPGAGDYLVRVRPLRWLTVNGPGAPRWRTEGAWTIVTVSGPGRYTVAS